LTEAFFSLHRERFFSPHFRDFFLPFHLLFIDRVSAQVTSSRCPPSFLTPKLPSRHSLPSTFFFFRVFFPFLSLPFFPGIKSPGASSSPPFKDRPPFFCPYFPFRHAFPRSFPPGERFSKGRLFLDGLPTRFSFQSIVFAPLNFLLLPASRNFPLLFS